MPVPLLTLRSQLLLASGTVIPIAGLLLDIPTSLVLAGIGIFLLGLLIYLSIDFYYSRKSLRHLVFDFSLPETLYSGTDSRLDLNISSDTLSQTLFLQLRPDVLEDSGIKQEIYSVTLSQQKNTDSLEHVFQMLSRGSFMYEGLTGRIARHSRIAFWQFDITLDKPLQFEVLPCANAQALNNRALHRLSGGNSVVDAGKGQGNEFDSLRKYAFGDSLQRIDWKRSARGRGLLVKVYKPDTHQRIHIALDCSRRMGNLLDNRIQFEHASDAAATLAQCVSQNDDEVGLFAFNHKIVSQINSGRGALHANRISKAISKIEISTLEADYQLLTEWAHMNKKRSLLVLITCISSSSGLDSIGKALLPARRKHLPLVFAVADRDLENIARTKAKNVEDAYIIAAAMEQINRIKHRTQMLNNQGIGCVYCDTASLSRNLERKYNLIKRSGRL